MIFNWKTQIQKMIYKSKIKNKMMIKLKNKKYKYKMILFKLIKMNTICNRKF